VFLSHCDREIFDSRSIKDIFVIDPAFHVIRRNNGYSSKFFWGLPATRPLFISLTSSLQKYITSTRLNARDLNFEFISWWPSQLMLDVRGKSKVHFALRT
jgi:hypothetical protein